jgi:hypothetical protein
MEIIDGRMNAGLRLPSNITALEFLQATYRSPDVPFHTRMRAAAIALPFESPKLQATATIGLSLDFSVRLERAVKRSDRVRVLARRPIELAQPDEPQSFRRRI